MESLPLLVLQPEEPAILPGERRRLLLESEAMAAAVRVAASRNGRLAVVAFDPAQRREGERAAAEGDRLLPVATGCRILRATPDEGFAVVRGSERLDVQIPVGLPAGPCCGGAEPTGPVLEAICSPLASGPLAFEAVEALERALRALDLLPPLRLQPTAEAQLDRIAHWLALPPWVQGEVLASPPDVRLRRIRDAAREQACPGSSFHPEAAARPYRGAAEYLADLVRDFANRAEAAVACSVSTEEERALALWRSGRLRRRRRSARLRVRAGRATLAARLAASAREGRLPVLERIRREQGLDERQLDALLVAGLATDERFGEPLRRAARLLPPAELPLSAWIAALESGAFATGAAPK